MQDAILTFAVSSDASLNTQVLLSALLDGLGTSVLPFVERAPGEASGTARPHSVPHAVGASGPDFPPLIHTLTRSHTLPTLVPAVSWVLFNYCALHSPSPRTLPDTFSLPLHPNRHPPPHLRLSRPPPPPPLLPIVCGNQQCEYGEQCLDVDCDGGTQCKSDCPFALKQCPKGSRPGALVPTQCSGRGTCNPGSGTCQCYVGYTGLACSACGLEFVSVEAACVLMPGALVRLWMGVGGAGGEGGGGKGSGWCGREQSQGQRSHAFPVHHFCSLLGAGPFAVGLQVSCTDGVRNGNEGGVDCGGPNCPQTCAQKYVFWARRLPGLAARARPPVSAWWSRPRPPSLR
jgi:hypothetical protein